MEFGFATDGTNNAFFDRILQTRVEVDLQEIKYCLEHCKIAQQPYKIGLELSERLCLGNCSKFISLDLTEEEPTPSDI